MVDRITKQLNKLSPKDRNDFEKLLTRIVSGKLTGLDVVKLAGRTDIFRVRKGAYRIIFRKSDDGSITILAFERRSDATYKGI